MPIIEVKDQDFESKVLGDASVMVDFWAPWCAPCKLAEPVLEELAKEYEGKVSVVKVNVDENPGSAQKYAVLSIPTTILFKNGVESGRQIGFAGRAGFEELIKKGL